MGINGEAIRPIYAILDPELTLSCPRSATVSAGVDSLVHATEAFVAKKTNPMAQLFAQEGFNIVMQNLPLLVDQLENINLREKVMYGAFLSAIALMNSGTGPAAAMSYPLGVRYGVPHGVGGGIFLPQVIRHNIDNGYLAYADLLNDRVAGQEKRDMAESFYTKIIQAWEQLQVPNQITSFGVTEDKLQSFISETMDLKLALDQNPVPFYEEQIETTLRHLISTR